MNSDGLEVNMHGSNIIENAFDLLLENIVRSIGRKGLQCLLRYRHHHPARLYGCDELLMKQCILPGTHIMSHNIGEFTTTWLHGNQHQRSFSWGTRKLYDTFVIEERAVNFRTTCRRKFIALHIQRYSLARGVNNILKWKMYGFPEQTPLFCTNMGQ